MKDWPRPLRRSAAAATLARAIYTARCEAWSLPLDAWDDVPVPTKAACDEVAHRIVDALRPEFGSTTAGKLFAFATQLAKEQDVR